MLLALIDGAETSLKLYYYIFASDKSGRLVLARLIRALRRGVSVTLMVDSFGSIDVNRAFFDPLVRAGGEIGWFGASWYPFPDPQSSEDGYRRRSARRDWRI